MKILFVVPYAPTPIRTRPYHLLRELRARDHRITLATLWQSKAERDALTALEHDGIEVLAEKLTWETVARNTLRATVSNAPIQSAYSWHAALAKQCGQKLAEFRRSSDAADGVLHVEHLRGVRYGLQLKSVAPTVWDSVDCISHLFEQASRNSQSRISRWMTMLELERTRRYEGRLVHQFERTLVTSPADKAALEQLADATQRPRSSDGSSAVTAPESPVAVLPNGVDLQHFRPPEQPRQPDTLVLSGKMSYHANVTAAHYFVREILPLIWKERPQTRLWLVGQNPPSSLRSLSSDPRILVTGYVEDLRSYLREATVAVCPLVYGTGIQNKVLEAMACATPVVTRSIGADALGARAGHEMLVSDTADGFALHVLNLLGNPELADRIGHAGRSYVERRHDWHMIGRLLENVYSEAIQLWHTRHPQ